MSKQIQAQSGPSRLDFMRRPCQAKIFVEGDTPTTSENIMKICGDVFIGSSSGPDYNAWCLGFLTEKDILDKLPKLKKTSRVCKVTVRINNGPEKVLWEKK